MKANSCQNGKIGFVTFLLFQPDSAGLNEVCSACKYSLSNSRKNFLCHLHGFRMFVLFWDARTNDPIREKWPRFHLFFARDAFSIHNQIWAQHSPRENSSSKPGKWYGSRIRRSLLFQWMSLSRFALRYFLLLSSPTHLNLLNHLPSLENEQKRRHPGSLETFSDKKRGANANEFRNFSVFPRACVPLRAQQFVPITIIESLRVSCDNKPSIIR